MSNETDFRTQKAVLWAVTTTPTDYGGYKLSAAAQIDVRWEERKHRVTDPRGNTIAADAEVVVGQAIDVGSVMWKGEKADLPSPSTSTTNLYKVVAYEEVPDIKGREIERTVSLQRLSDSLPELA